MADSNATGPVYGNRRASLVTRHTFPFDFSQRASTTAGIQLAIIRASADKPVQVIASVQVIAAFNSGTSDTITLGTTTTATEIIPSGVTAGSPGYYPTATTRARFVVDTPIYLKYTSAGTAPTTGTGVVLVEAYTENTKAIL